MNELKPGQSDQHYDDPASNSCPIYYQSPKSPGDLGGESPLNTVSGLEVDVQLSSTMGTRLAWTQYPLSTLVGWFKPDPTALPALDSANHRP
ncbi:hypothetical protein RRG08_014605 [Elysia crispata]|uniref:Uncharacterized protein n=1 Tax=Elysia crispata TaxID=231223 RepID=A0AAE1D3D8_9GAST|nr:hypothetical protein RRG08_014605 [Elysia crispata]